MEKQFDDDTVSVDEHRALKVEREREREAMSEDGQNGSTE